MARQRNATSTLHHYLGRLPRGGRRGRIGPGVAGEAADGAEADRLALENLGLVVSVARRYWFDGVALDDLIQSGNLGLLRASRSFDRSRGTGLPMWLSFGIRRAILDHLAANQHAVALPRNVHQRLLRGDHQAEARPQRTDRLRPVPLDETEGTDDGGRAARLLPCQPDEAPAAVERAALSADIDELLATLDDSARRLIVERFGLDGCAPRGTVAQAADRGISREAVRLRYNTAMARLAREARSRRLEEWLDRS